MRWPPAAEYRARLNFAMKFQQYTSPLQAKGIEGTAFYRYNVLASLNEVGGDPQRFGGTVQQFHEANLRRLQHCPHTMLATATHDAKRGEDARARLNVLSEIPEEWRQAVSRWSRLNAGNRTIVDGTPAPDRSDEYLFYQALLGAWPAEAAGVVPVTAAAELVQRLRDYMLKAVKETKVQRLPRLFQEGEYLSLFAEGAQRDHVVAVARRLGDQQVIAVSVRLAAGLLGEGASFPVGADVWQGTQLVLSPPLRKAVYANVLTGQLLRPSEQEGRSVLLLGEVLRACPVALLL